MPANRSVPSRSNNPAGASGLFRPLAGPAAALALLAGCAAHGVRDQVVREVDPESLVGLGPAALTARLGEPELRRQERPVEVWQYRSDSCVLDLFFDSAAGGGPQVVYYEARHRAEGEVQPARCLGEIVALAAAEPAG